MLQFDIFNVLNGYLGLFGDRIQRYVDGWNCFLTFLVFRRFAALPLFLFYRLWLASFSTKKIDCLFECGRVKLWRKVSLINRRGGLLKNFCEPV